MITSNIVNITQHVPDEKETSNDEESQIVNPKFAGDKQVLAIKVDTMDAKTTISASKIRNKVFGFGDDEITFKSQLSACSYDKINFVPFNGNTTGGNPISNGVVEIYVPIKVQGMSDDSDLTMEVIKLTQEKYGAIPDQFDHVLIILP